MNISCFTDRNSSLKDLLPYDKSSVRQKGAQEYAVLVSAAKETIGALREGCLELFDALVGDNMCQVRAILISMLAQPMIASLGDLEKELETSEAHITEAEAFLTSCRILTKTKEETGFLQADKRNVKSLTSFGVSGTFVDGFIKKLQANVASYSVAFMESCARVFAETGHSFALRGDSRLVWRGV